MKIDIRYEPTIYRVYRYMKSRSINIRAIHVRIGGKKQRHNEMQWKKTRTKKDTKNHFKTFQKCSS